MDLDSVSTSIIRRILCLDSVSMSSRAYRARSRPKRSEETRERITAAVRELLAEGTFHESTVEQVADRAGIARATLYQHFRSRLELVDAICETFDQNGLQSLRGRIDGGAQPCRSGAIDGKVILRPRGIVEPA